MEEAPSDAPQTLPQALGRLRVALEDAFLRASRELGLTAQQAELLCAAMRPAAVGELAHALRCDRSNVSRLVDRAATRGLVKRRTGELDGRVTVVELTTEGERLARRFIAALEAQTRALRADWPAARQQTAVGLLNEIADALDAPSEHSTSGRVTASGGGARRRAGRRARPRPGAAPARARRRTVPP